MSEDPQARTQPPTSEKPGPKREKHEKEQKLDRGDPGLAHLTVNPNTGVAEPSDENPPEFPGAVPYVP
jgi:hypothetical protein